jgi:hypothetical protein
MPVISRVGLLGCVMLRIPYSPDIRLTDGGKVVSLKGRLCFTPQNHYFSASGIHFC